MQKPICVSRCKITTFPRTRKRMDEILLQCIGIGCLFLHELPLMYHELSLIVWGILRQGVDGSSSHVTPLVFSFSNRKDPNFAQTFQMIRMGSVRDCFLDLLSLTEMNRTVSKTFGCFGWVRFEVVLWIFFL